MPNSCTSVFTYIDHLSYRKSDIGALGWSYSNDLLSYDPFKDKGSFGRDFRFYASLYERWEVSEVKVFCDFMAGNQPVVYSIVGNSTGVLDFSKTSYDTIKKNVQGGYAPDFFLAPNYNRKSSYYIKSRDIRGSRSSLSGLIDRPPDTKFSVVVNAFNPNGSECLEIYPLIRVRLTIDWYSRRPTPIDTSWYDIS